MAEIDHVVVLMLENRSFDSMLGQLYPAGPGFNGLIGNEQNYVNGAPIRVWNGGAAGGSNAVPSPDPGELFDDITAQIFGANQAAGPADMSGFAKNYAGVPGANPRDIMHFFKEDDVPVISTLAKAFGVSDCWFASAPNQTWPNRFFAHTGTAAGHVNNLPLHAPYMMETVFNRLSQANCSWRIYYHDIPQTATLTRLWSSLPDHLYLFEDHFMADAMAGRLPNYSFIEPRYFSCPLINRLPNDQHPPHDVNFGERLIARCYDAIRNGAGWDRTLFIVTYDEHGGLYDHVPPPPAVPPDDPPSVPFAFDRYGVRVPALLISPWIPPGTVVRPPRGSPYPFDHTSILAALRSRFFPQLEPLTRRDAAAPHFWEALSLPSPSNTGPSGLMLPTNAPPAAAVFDAHAAPPNHMQQALAEFTGLLPTGAATVDKRAAAISGTPAATKTHSTLQTVKDALDKAEAGLTWFLRGPGAVP